jgi:hypothetical protein
MKHRNRLAAERARRQAELERENATCAAVLAYREAKAKRAGRIDLQLLAARAIFLDVSSVASKPDRGDCRAQDAARYQRNRERIRARQQERREAAKLARRD